MAKSKKVVPPSRMDADLAAEATSAEADVKYLDQQALSWKNILGIKKEIRKESKNLNTLQEDLNKLGAKGAKESKAYLTNINNLKRSEQDLLKARLNGNEKDISIINRRKAIYEDEQKILLKTAGARKQAQIEEGRRIMKGYSTELGLIGKVNEKRTIGERILEKFRSKKTNQDKIDIARANASGGANIPGEGGVGGSATKTKGFKESKVGGFLIGVSDKLKGPLNEIQSQARAAIVAPFADAANLLTGESFGMGGGKANASGATSILGGLSSMVKTIPFIGGLLGGLVDIFKGLVDALLGIDQANFRVARSMNISVDAAREMRKEFKGIADASGNLIMNDARLFQSYVEIGSQLGINKKLGIDIYDNDVKLRDVLGLEAQSRKVISDQAIITGRNAKELTQSAIGTVESFNKLVGTSFKWSSILSEASKLGGLLGLTLTKFPEKIYNAVAATKALGFDLKQLDATAGSFLDFEGSISKEMEAQVLTGKDLNLTAAREAALNNDNVTLAKEITKNVGSANDYLKMYRIQQEGIAAAVGMTRDSLADVLKNQEIYTRAGVTDEKGLVARLDLLQKQKKTQEEISAVLGKDGYALATQVSTAESLTEVMERIKIVVVDFVKNTGLFDFLTKPEKINAFITGLTDKLGGFIKWIGNAIATLLEGLGSFVHIFSSSTGDQLMSIAAQARGGSADLGSSIQAIGANLGGAVSNSISGTKEAGVQKQTTQQTTPQQGAYVAVPQTFTANLFLDGQQITSTVLRTANETPGINKK